MSSVDGSAFIKGGKKPLLARIKTQFLNHSAQYVLMVETLLIFALFQILTNGTFLTSRNLNNLMMQGVTYALMGIGLVFVIVSGNMDLSGGSVLGFLAAVAAVVQVKIGIGAVGTIAITIAAGLLVGLWQGYWVAYRNVPAFIVTLANMLIFRGATLWVGEGKSVGPVSKSFAVFGKGYLPKTFFLDSKYNDTSIMVMLAVLAFLAVSILHNRRQQIKYGIDVGPVSKTIAKIIALSLGIGVISLVLISYQGFPVALLVLGLFMYIFTFVANGTTFGRYTYAIGGSRDATQMSGINVKWMVLKIYVLMGFCVSIATVIFLGRVGQSTAQTGTNFEFSAITGCIVGGVSTLGGRGTIVGAVLGTMLMSGLDNGMSLLNLDSTYQYLVKGLVLLIAVGIDVSSQQNKA